MSLPTPSLDDRRFQDIVDEAKRLIPQFCPEWTDHNVSDPGVALIELFAWMTDMLLYRVNQVPDKIYTKFLELIGVKLDPPRAARVPVTFYLSAPQPNEIVIPKGTEVATVRTETNSAIVFSTDVDLAIRPPVVLGAFTRGGKDDNSGWVVHKLNRLALRDSLSLFPEQPAVGNAFVIALKEDHSHHVMALSFECENAGGTGVDPENPPLEWQVWQGGIVRWARCALEHDGTRGFNIDGEIILHLPAMTVAEFEGTRAFWLRCRLTDAQRGQSHYDLSPKLRGPLKIEARGGTAPAHHAITIENEIVGYSDGTPGSTFQLLNTPILPRDPTTDNLVVKPPIGPAQDWLEVQDFADSGEKDHHYTLDDLDGTVTLGPALLQPDGSVYRFGAVPTKGSLLSFSRYQVGGGVTGNLPKGALSIIKSSIPYVSYVSNREPAIGGLDGQSLADAKLRAPRNLRTRSRAVTASDYEILACEVPGIARASCFAPGKQPGDPESPQPGHVLVTVLPDVESPRLSIRPESLVLSADLRDKVASFLSERCLLGCVVDVRAPQYTWVAIVAKLRVAENSDPSLKARVREKASDELYRYVNPFDGGPNGKGWPFGRDLSISEIYGLLQRIPFVEFVDDVQIAIGEPGGGAPPRPASSPIKLRKFGLVCSLAHEIRVT